MTNIISLTIYFRRISSIEDISDSLKYIDYSIFFTAPPRQSHRYKDTKHVITDK
jgi:hypothetical protein